MYNSHFTHIRKKIVLQKFWVKNLGFLGWGDKTRSLLGVGIVYYWPYAGPSPPDRSGGRWHCPFGSTGPTSHSGSLKVTVKSVKITCWYIQRTKK